MQIYWTKRKRLHKKRVQLPKDGFGTPTWPPFHCFEHQYGSVTSRENTLFKLHGSMTKTPISDLHNARLPSKLSRYPPNVSASPFGPFARDSCWYFPNRKFARGPIGETTHVWVTREIRVLWKAIILRIYIYEHVWFSKSLNITLSLTSSNSREMWFGCDLKTYSRLRSVPRAFLRTSWV